MKKALAMLAVVLTVGLTAVDAEAAKRLGGGKSSGMQRQQTTEMARTPNAPGAQPGQQAGATAAAPAAAGATAAAAQKRSWMGPIAGLAAGLGLAALASHLGFGEAFANILMIALLAFAVMAVIGFVLRKRMAGQQPAMAGAGAGGFGGMARQQAELPQAQPAAQPMQRGSLIGSRIGAGLGGGAAASTAVGRIPADFDAEGFARNAKSQFMALQAANDTKDLNRLREYLTPEMFAAIQQDLAERGDAPQTTEVFGLEARVLDVAEEPAEYVVSVRFTGSVRSEPGVEPDALDEVWHLTKPKSGFGGWVIAGIEQV